MENTSIESCNGRLRDECLNVHQFTSIADAQKVLLCHCFLEGEAYGQTASVSRSVGRSPVS